MLKPRFIVTAGPTREFLDPVRFLSNPSTGRMGFAVARAAVRAGGEVTLIAGPVVLKTPKGVSRLDVVSAREMCEAVVAAVRAARGRPTVLVMTAAVADYRPAAEAKDKIKKTAMPDTLKLVRNPDILRTVRKLVSASPDDAYARFVRVGFAAETGTVEAEAVRKCRDKGLDLVVGNNVLSPGCGFGVRTNQVTFVTPDGGVRPLPLMSKDAVARRIVRFCLSCLSQK